MAKKRLLIIGAGYAGLGLAKAMHKLCEVTLVDRHADFFHNVASIRAIVDPSLAGQIIFPLQRFRFARRIIQGDVTEVAPGGAVLADGSRLEADIVVVATGSGYNSPFKLSGDSATLRQDLLRVNAEVQAAGKLAIVGGGAVGIELAGEIAAAMPGKSITLIAADSRLFPTYPQKLHDRLAAELKDIGVALHLNEKLDLAAARDGKLAGPLRLSGGTILDPDLALLATGSRPEASLLGASAGRARTDSWMRPASQPDLFTLGDAADNGDGMTIVGASRQIQWLAGTLRATLNGATVESRKPYKPWRTAPILLPLGPVRGASFLPVGREGWVMGRGFTARLKGRDLFIPRYKAMFDTA